MQHENVSYFPSPRKTELISSLRGCVRCTNKMSCNELQNLLKQVRNQLETDYSAETKSLKKMRVINEHLVRQRFRFPYVRDFATCWFHNKYGVILNFVDQIRVLLKGNAA